MLLFGLFQQWWFLSANHSQILYSFWILYLSCSINPPDDKIPEWWGVLIIEAEFHTSWEKMEVNQWNSEKMGIERNWHFLWIFTPKINPLRDCAGLVPQFLARYFNCLFIEVVPECSERSSLSLEGCQFLFHADSCSQFFVIFLLPQIFSKEHFQFLQSCESDVCERTN